MSETDTGSVWGLLALVGVLGGCCISLATLASGATLVGGAAAGVTTAGGAAGGLRGILVSGLATALPLFIIGLVLRRRTQ